MVGVSILVITHLKVNGSREVVIIEKVVAVTYAMKVITLLVTALKEGVSSAKDLHTINRTVEMFTGVCIVYLRASQQGIAIVLRVGVVEVIIMEMISNASHILTTHHPGQVKGDVSRMSVAGGGKISLLGLPF